MFRNYFKTAWRNLFAHKFYSLLNISGLAVGLATGIMLLLWVQNEFSYNKFHKKADRTYLVNVEVPSVGKPMFFSVTPGPLFVMAKKIPGVQSVVRISDETRNLEDVTNNKVVTDNNVGYVDSSFLSVFDFELIKGSGEKLLPDIHSIALTQKTAQRLFNGGDAMGKTVRMGADNFTITAILKDFPENSTLQYDALLPMSFYAQEFTKSGGNGQWKTIDEDLGNIRYATYVVLHPKASPDKVARGFDKLYLAARNDNNKIAFHLQRLTDTHLVANDGTGAALKMVQVMLLVAFLLLAIAGINYVNLSTARVLTRVKEVGIRKIIGAERSQLFLQFIVETLLLFCFALLLAFLLVFLLTPLYNSISGKAIRFSFHDMNMWKAIGIAASTIFVLSGLYPAILLSSFNPLKSIKGKSTAGVGVAAFRKALVVFQFAISVILCVCTLVMSRQMEYIRTKDLGYDKSYVFAAAFPYEAVQHTDAIKAELLKTSAVSSVGTAGVDDISNVTFGSGDIEWEGKPANAQMMISEVPAAKDFIPTLKLRFLEGHDFSGTPSDSNKFILNETAVKQMGLKPPYVGQPIVSHDKKGVILGVVKDFNFQPLTRAIGPLLFHTFWKGNIFYVRTTGAEAQIAIRAVEKQYKKYAGNLPFKYSFLDEKFDTHYKEQSRAGVLFNFFAGIAIFISCLGLFGLTTYTAQVKIKEIGIRKVLGASVAGILILLSRDFLKLIAVAIIIAIPVSYWWMNSWLQHFAYKTALSWFLFIVPAVLVVLFALATMSFQSIKAAVTNPVKSLRTE